jgi:hypothetical protein
MRSNLIFSPLTIIVLKKIELCFSVRVTGAANLCVSSCLKSPGHYILKFVSLFYTMLLKLIKHV